MRDRPPHPATPRLRLPFVAGIALLIAACVVFVRTRFAGNGDTDAGENPHSKNPHATSDLSEATAPALTRKPRPTPDEIAAARKAREDGEASAVAEAERRERLATYLAPGYKLTSRFLAVRASFGLGPEQFNALQKVLDEERDYMVDWTGERMVFDELASKQAMDGIRIFRMRGLGAEEMKERRLLLQEALEGAAPDVSWDIIADLRDAVGYDPAFGRYGAADCDIRIVPVGTLSLRMGTADANPVEEPAQDGYSVTYTLSDPASGKMLYQKKSGFTEFCKDFGRHFPLGSRPMPRHRVPTAPH